MSFLTRLIAPLQACENTAAYLLSRLNVPFTRIHLQTILLEHPDYPSLLSISDVFKKYRVYNIAIRISADNLAQLPLPCIAHIQGSRNDEELIVIQKITPSLVEIYNPLTNKVESNNREEFVKVFKGTVLLVEAEDDAGEKEFIRHQKQETRVNMSHMLVVFLLPAVCLLVCVFALFSYPIHHTIAPVTYTLLCLLETVAGALLVWYEVDEYNPVVREICQTRKKINCGAVLNSKASRVMGMSWGSVGAIYFMSTLLVLLINGIVNPVMLLVLGCISILVLPYTLFSIYYQWRAIKQWCVLCLAVQAIFLLQIIIAWAGGFYNFSFLPAAILQSILSVVVSSGILYILSSILLPTLKKAKLAKNKTTELQRLKHNTQIFEALVPKQKSIERSPEDLGISLGNPNGKFKLIKVCNPYCGPCAKAHPVMEEIIENNEEVGVQVIFTATNDEKDIKRPPVIHFLAIAAKNDAVLTRQALDDWYMAEKKDYEVFAAKYPMTKELKLQEEKINNMQEWCNAAQITFTPTFFISVSSVEEGKFHQLPDLYTLTDLEYFLAV